jgi:hypothetical protein
MKRAITAVLAAATLGLVAAATTAASAAPAATGYVRLGGLNIAGFCINHGYVSAGLSAYSVQGWRCLTTNGNAGLNLSSICAEQYPAYPGDARYTSFTNPYSLGCYKYVVSGQ